MCLQAPYYPIKNVFPGYAAKRKRFLDKLESKRSRPLYFFAATNQRPFSNHR